MRRLYLAERIRPNPIDLVLCRVGGVGVCHEVASVSRLWSRSSSDRIFPVVVWLSKHVSSFMGLSSFGRIDETVVDAWISRISRGETWVGVSVLKIASFNIVTDVECVLGC